MAAYYVRGTHQEHPEARVCLHVIARAKTEGYEDAMENAPVPDGLSYMGAHGQDADCHAGEAIGLDTSTRIC
jgi:hypothetical protein